MPIRMSRAIPGTPSARSAAPVLPMDISQSPLMSAGLLPDELFATLAGPLPTITIGLCPAPPSPRLGTQRAALRSPCARDQMRTKPSSKPCSPRAPASPVSPRQVESLLSLLEEMEHDVAAEVRRVRLGIQETRWLVRAYREDSAAREAARQERMEQGAW